MKYIKIDWILMQKYQEESWYEEFCYEWNESSIHDSNRVVFVPEDIYNKCIFPAFKVGDNVFYQSLDGDEYKGVVLDILDSSEPYPIIVKLSWGGVEEDFTLDGRWDKEGEICLFKQ